jgi:N-methylhydantoinase A
MAGAIRLVSIERGHNPRDFVAMTFGGGGALHAGALIKDVGLAKALVPRFPGVTSALGCVIADMRHDFVLTLNRLLDELDIGALDREIRRFAGNGRAMLDRSGVRFTARDVLIELDMSYVGQTHTVAVPLTLEIGEERTDVSRERIAAAFQRRYREVFGRLLDGIAARVLNLRLAVVGRRPKLDLALLAPPAGRSAAEAALEPRRVYVEGKWIEAPVYRRLDLPVGSVVPGPAILEQPDTTIFIDPDLQGDVDRFGNVVISRKPG